jgi:hypothetical protein
MKSSKVSIWVTVTLQLMCWLGKALVDVQHAIGVPAVNGTPVAIPVGTAPVTQAIAVDVGASSTRDTASPLQIPAPRPTWAMFALALALSPSAFYVAITAMASVLDTIRPWS